MVWCDVWCLWCDVCVMCDLGVCDVCLSVLWCLGVMYVWCDGCDVWYLFVCVVMLVQWICNYLLWESVLLTMGTVGTITMIKIGALNWRGLYTPPPNPIGLRSDFSRTETPSLPTCPVRENYEFLCLHETRSSDPGCSHQFSAPILIVVILPTVSKWFTHGQ